MRYFTKSTIALLSACSIQFATAENLLDLYNLAKDRDQIMQAAWQAHLATLEELPQARALLLPTITATSTTTNTKYKANEKLQQYNTGQNGINISQPIFQMASWNKLSQAKDTVKMAFATLASAEQSLLLRIATQYFATLKAQDNLHFMQAQQKAFAKQLEQTKQRYKVGLIAVTDVLIAQAKHDGALAQVIETRNSLSNANEKLRELIGQNIAYLAPLKLTIPLITPQPAKIEHWVQLATEKNWDLQAARYNLAISRKQIQQNQAGHYPTLNLTANVNRIKNAPPTTAEKATNKDVGLQFNLPLFNGGNTLSKIKQASYNYAKVTANLEGQYRATESNARQAYRGVLDQLSQINALKQAVISNASALKATHAAFEVGNRTIVDVLNAQSDLINAEKDHASARYDYILQSLALKQVAGILSVEDLQEVNSWLQPEKNLAKI